MTEYLAELEAQLCAIELPEGFLRDYEPLECLAHSHGTETFLVREKGGAKEYIAKCYDRGVFRSVSESAILQRLSHSGLPAFVGEYQDEDFVCVVREYIEGTPLDRYMGGRRLPPARAVSLCVKLCDLLSYLHAQTPRIIHRDIKPQNVIVRPDGDVALIDFDIARTFDDGAPADTRFIGTRVYAPPEQYGFAQTDQRTDIYALGVLLCYMLTGCAVAQNAPIASRRLAAVVRRCTALAPDNRFQSAAEVKRALLRADGGRRARAARALALCLAAFMLLSAGFSLGRYTPFLRAAPAAGGLSFSQDLMERAARAQLGKAEGAPLAQEELRRVRSIYIFGTEVSGDKEAFARGLDGWTLPRGNLTSLADAALLPGLETLYVNYQTLSDISPVAQLRNLRYLDLRHTYVEDISPLAGLPGLEELSLFDTNVADLAPLKTCPRLASIDLGYTLISSVADIPDLKALTHLGLRKCSLGTLAGIERFPRLESLCLCETGLEDLSPVLGLPYLKELSVDESMRAAVRALGETGFTVRYE